jgi:hypothetical protein
MFLRRIGLIAVGFLLASGCTPTNIAQTSLQEPLGSQTTGETLRLQNSVSVDLPSGYSADDLDPNTTWRQIGTIPQGQVLKPVATLLMVKAGPPHYDAYLVINQNMAVGIYLHDQSAFVNMTPPQFISFATVKP